MMLDRMEQFLRSRLAEETSIGARGKGFVPSMTISRQCGAGLDQIAPRLVDYLSEVDDSSSSGWALFDQSLIGKIIEEHDLPTTVQPYLDENAKFPVAGIVEEVLALHPGQWSLFNYSADTIRKLCHLGNAVVVGRAGNFVASDFENTFHARVVGSLDRRVEYTSKRYDVPLNRAREIVKKTDKGRKNFVKRYAAADIGDPQFYHIVVNTDDLSIDSAAGILAESMLAWAHE
jgi:cytidylate kinase